MWKYVISSQFTDDIGQKIKQIQKLFLFVEIIGLLISPSSEKCFKFVSQSDTHFLIFSDYAEINVSNIKHSGCLHKRFFLYLFGKIITCVPFSVVVL